MSKKDEPFEVVFDPKHGLRTSPAVESWNKGMKKKSYGGLRLEILSQAGWKVPGTHEEKLQCIRIDKEKEEEERRREEKRRRRPEEERPRRGPGKPAKGSSTKKRK